MQNNTWFATKRQLEITTIDNNHMYSISTIMTISSFLIFYIIF